MSFYLPNKITHSLFYLANKNFKYTSGSGFSGLGTSMLSEGKKGQITIKMLSIKVDKGRINSAKEDVNIKGVQTGYKKFNTVNHAIKAKNCGPNLSLMTNFIRY